MEKKLTIRECLELKAEILGFKNESNGQSVRGLLNEKLSFKTKYWLHKAVDKLVNEEKAFHKLRDELIKKYGEGDDQKGYSVPLKKDDKPNPNHAEFMKELLDLLEEKTDTKLKGFTLDSLDFESEYHYPVFVSIIEENENVNQI